MATSDTELQPLLKRPKRADALRNYEKLIAAARDAFTEQGSAASLEDIARRAGVGIGTLYRNFPTREDLLEAVYVGEVLAISEKAAEYEHLEPWDALVGWLREYAQFATTKREIGEQMLATMDADAPVFQTCRGAVLGPGERLLKRAQDAGAVRPDVAFTDVGRMIGGIASMRGASPDEVEHILGVALDGLRYRA